MPGETKLTRYDNDRIYTDYSFDDKTSQFDTGGSKYYSRTYRCRVPRRMLERAKESGDYDEVTTWLEKHDCTPGVWR